MAPMIGMATSATESQWYYTHDELALPPSVREGMSLAEERRRRQDAVKMIWKLRDKTTVKQPVVTAAATFMHRFYMRETFQNWDCKYTAVAAMVLASKSEEEPRSIRTFSTYTAEILMGAHVDPHAQQGEIQANSPAGRAREQILAHEEAMLRVLCFDLTVRHPPWIAVQAVKAVWTGDRADEGDKVARAAWMFLNDSLPSTLCLLYTPPVLAAAAIVLACAQLDLALPGPPPSIAEQRALYELAVQEAEEGEETPLFEPKPFWLDMIGVKAAELKGPVMEIVDGYKLAKDPFVVAEGEKLAAKAEVALRNLTAPPTGSPLPSPVQPASSTTPATASPAHRMDLS